MPHSFARHFIVTPRVTSPGRDQCDLIAMVCSAGDEAVLQGLDTDSWVMGLPSACHKSDLNGLLASVISAADNGRGRQMCLRRAHSPSRPSCVVTVCH